MSRNLVRLIDRALRHRPTLFDEAGSIYLEKHGYTKKDTPTWYTDLPSDKDRCKAAPFLVWLWDWVRPVLMELAASPKDIRILLAKLPRPVAIPKLVQGKRGYTADTQACRKFHARFDVPPVHLWVLWQRWREIAAGPQRLPDAPPYPGAVCPTGARQDHCRWKPIPKDVCKVLEECPRLFEELAAGPLNLHRLSFEARHCVDLLCDALRWLRQKVAGRTTAVSRRGNAGRRRPPVELPKSEPQKAPTHVNPTLQKAAAFIRRHHGSNAAQIAKHCGVEPDTIRNLAKDLKKMGFKSRRGCTGGYWPTDAAK
jgi:hypothetical protein